jgi:acyl carrier protein
MKGEKLREQAQKWLREWFASRGKLGKSAGENLLDTDYFAAGWLSSMEIVEFVTETERQFGIQFSETDLQDRRFVTISGLSELILEHSTNTEQVR